MHAALRESRRPWLIGWITTWTLLVLWQSAAAALGGSHAIWSSPTGLFVIVVAAASLCVIASIVLVVVAWTNESAELGLLGAFAFAVSILPLVHGLTTPGVLYGSNAATTSSVLWALPIGSLALVPLISPRSSISRSIARHWKSWSMAYSAALTAFAVGLLARPSLLPAPRMGAAGSIFVGGASLAACFAMSVRHLRLSWIGASRRPLMVSLGFALVGTSNLVWVARAPFTAGFWLAHAFDVIGVFAVIVGAGLAYRQRLPIRHIVGPLVANQPLSAFELGLEPLVHQFVAALETKDAITRDHVVRTAERAILLGQHLRLPATEVHRLGLGALLHDLGKLTMPDAILNKPGRLDPDEFEIIKTHTIAGEQLVKNSAVLQGIGPILRSHHERVDGAGYPDGLADLAIPRLARIVSVCDAYDAMAHTRQYREGLGHERAIAVLREHAGSQWDPRIVEALIASIDSQPTVGSLDNVGRSDMETGSWYGCRDALPPPLSGGCAFEAGSITSVLPAQTGVS